MPWTTQLAWENQLRDIPKTNGCVRGKDRIEGRILGGQGRRMQKENKENVGLLSRTFRIKGREEYHCQKTLTVSHQGVRAVQCGFWLRMVVTLGWGSGMARSLSLRPALFV